MTRCCPSSPVRSFLHLTAVVRRVLRKPGVCLPSLESLSDLVVLLSTVISPGQPKEEQPETL